MIVKQRLSKIVIYIRKHDSIFTCPNKKLVCYAENADKAMSQLSEMVNLGLRQPDFSIIHFGTHVFNASQFVRAIAKESHKTIKKEINE